MNVKKMRDFFKPHYRIVADKYLSKYSVEVWNWYWPFWVNASCFGRKYETIEDAEFYGMRHPKRVVKYLGTIKRKADD
jgi:hypothetical protein